MDDPTLFDAVPRKRCPQCGETKLLSEFVRNRSTRTGWGAHCRPCHNRVTKTNRDRLHGSGRSFQLKRRYGIDEAQVELLVMAQLGACPICFESPQHLDHDHPTGHHRGVLCFKCNNALGKFGDDPGTMRRALEYLERGYPGALDTLG